MMQKEASPEEVEVFVTTAVERLVKEGMAQDVAEQHVTAVLTKRAEELGLVQPQADLSPEDVIIGTAYEKLVASGMDDKQASAALQKALS